MGRVHRRRDRWPKRVLEFATRWLLRRPKLDFESIRATGPRRIVIVRQHDQLGDMVCATAALRAIRHNFPHAQILLVTAPIHDAVVRHHPDVDSVLLFDKVRTRHSPSHALRFLRELRGFRADLAFVLNTVSFSSTSAWFAVFSGARFIIGGDSTPFGWGFSRWLYSLELPSDPAVSRHAIDHGLWPLESVGMVVADRTAVLVPGPIAEREATSFLEGLGSPPVFAAVHPGAGKAENRWPAEFFAQAVRALEARGAQVLLIEGPADAAAVAALEAALGRALPVLREVNAATVAAVLARSAVVLVNDTGVLHLAGAMGAGGVALFGPTRREHWAPPSTELIALQSPDATMRGLRPELVLPVLLERLERGRGSRLRPRPSHHPAE